MKYFGLVWAGLARKKLRTLFTMLSIVIAFLLFGLLQGINQGMNRAFDNLGADRLYILRRVSMDDGLPFAHYDRIKSVPGVTAVTHWSYVGGFYQNAQQSLPVFAVDPTTVFEVYSRIRVPRAQIDALIHTRNGAIISREIAAKYGWRIGDRVPLGSSIWTKRDGTNTFPVDIVGIMDISAHNVGSFPQFFINYDYLNQERAFAKDFVFFYIAKIDAPQYGSAIADAIDARFANSAFETQTQTEQVFAQSQINQVGDIGVIANSIVGAVLFALLFLTGNTMMQSVRERTPELAVLKTLGFSDTKVLSLVMLESLALCLFAGVLGLLLARIAFVFVSAFLGALTMPLAVIGIGIGLSVLLAIATGFPPAWRTMRINVVDALAGR